MPADGSRSETDTDTDDPWYIEHSERPKGGYGARPFLPTAEDRPENRRGVLLYNHHDYADTTLQRRIASGLAILRDYPERVVLVGGYIERGGNCAYRHIRWKPDDQVYEMTPEDTGWTNNRETYPLLSDVLNALDEAFNDDSFIFARLIWQKNSPFNIPANTRRVSFRA